LGFSKQLPTGAVAAYAGEADRLQDVRKINTRQAPNNPQFGDIARSSDAAARIARVFRVYTERREFN